MHGARFMCVVISGGVLGLGIQARVLGAPVVFDDFNAGEGHFATAPNFSSTSSVLSTSTADRTTAAGEVLEGAGAEKLVLDAPASGIVRSRFLSNTGSPTGQTSFSVSSASTDGFIGFVYKVVGSGNGLQLGINLDAPGNTGATMVGGNLKAATADGKWHVVEWNLDSPSTDWGAVSGIGGTSANLEAAGDNPHTIDSLYFYNMAANSTTTVLIDYVAKTDSGIADALAPAKVTTLAPVSGSTGIDSTSPLTLSWAGGANDSAYDVYLGNDPAALTEVSAGQSDLSYSLNGLLPGTTYYWRVDAENLLGSVASGDVSSFATAAVPEPATIGLSAVAGLLLLGGRRRRGC